MRLKTVFRGEEGSLRATESCELFKLWVTFVSSGTVLHTAAQRGRFVRAVTAALPATDAYRVTLRSSCKGRLLWLAVHGLPGCASGVNLEDQVLEGLALPRPRTMVSRVWRG